MKDKARFVLIAGLLFGAFNNAGAQHALVTTYVTPPPNIGFQFGGALASDGRETVLIGDKWGTAGSMWAGAAYLYGTNGTLVTTFTNPVPQRYSYFGYSVAMLGSDKVLVGAYEQTNGVANGHGAVYLFNTNGSLLNTFNSPFKGGFGYQVASLGTDRFIVGGAVSNATTAYLLDTNGTMLKAFTNFGFQVATFGTDRLLLSKWGGGGVGGPLAYLLDTNAILLTAFPSPVPTTNIWVTSMSAVGDGHVILGAPDRGAAYLFDTNGVLVTTFTNPPGGTPKFGYSVAGVGTGKVVIGASSENPIVTGMAYLFSTNGQLLSVITNGGPTLASQFGISVVAVGPEHFIVGANHDVKPAGVSGAAFLYTLNADITPALRMFLTYTNTMVAAWGAPSAGWRLESSTNQATDWTTVTNPVKMLVPENQVVIPRTANSRFLRLVKP